MASGELILIVDDDPDVTNLLEAYLVDAGYKVVTSSTAEQMWEYLEEMPTDLILLDVGLPDGNGFDLTKVLQLQFDAGIIILSRLSDPVDQVVGLELGADDYVTKPFEPRTLLARIRSVLRRRAGPLSRGNGAIQKTLTFGRWEFTPAFNRLSDGNGIEFTLSANESSLLAYMIKNANAVMSREILLNAISNRNWEYMDRSIDILIARLRKKIEIMPSQPQFIKTVRGKGYVFAWNEQNS